jgi:hypothetical protein
LLECELTDIPVMAREAREGDRDPYPSLHEAVKGLRRPSIGEGRRWWSELDERVLKVRR